ncbi:MAG: hypothetical protein QM654_16365 [Dysgonamonadaceae bacterium]
MAQTLQKMRIALSLPLTATTNYSRYEEWLYHLENRLTTGG